MTKAEVEVNAQGRVTIPAQMRRDLGIHEGSRLVASIEDGRLVLEERSHILERFRAQLRATRRTDPSSSVVGSLIEDRRTEAERETGREGKAK